jgi:hypothetical protein
MRSEKARDVDEEDPPFGIWAHWYLAVLLTLVGMIALSYIFTSIYT